MYHHRFFDLWLHDDAELSGLLGSPLVARTTLHEWPLSCVQRLRTQDGRTRIYKVQAEPTVEPAFYAHVHSPLLVGVTLLDAYGVAPPALLLDEVAAPRLLDLHPTEAEALRMGYDVQRHIARIAGQAPVWVDLGSWPRWEAYAATVLADLDALMEAGTFWRVTPALLDRLAQQLAAPSVRVAFDAETGYVHHDLSADNLFVLPDGYRVIDWQRPIVGPVALDLAALLTSLGIDPGRHVPIGVVQLLHLLHIAWFAQCARHWFPAGATTYDALIVELVAHVDQVGAA